jgi:urease accessory protein
MKSPKTNRSLIFTQIVKTEVIADNLPILSLTAQERTRSRQRYQTPEGEIWFLQVPRGRVLKEGDLLQTESKEIIKIAAKPEPVLTVKGKAPLDLIRAAYHLGNRHVALEITEDYLRLTPDPVLEKMLASLGLEITKEIVPFYPVSGAYTHSH